MLMLSSSLSGSGRVAAAAITVALYGVPDAVTATSAVPNADAIFSRARDAASAQRCPARLEYVIVVEAHVDGHVEQNHFRARYLSDLDYLDVDAFSDEEQRSPYVPHGVNIEIIPLVPLVDLSRALTAKVNHDGPPLDLLGVPELKPSYTFGLRRASAHQPSPQADDSPLRLIGSTTARSRDYAVNLVALELYEGVQAYHLRLTPLHDPARYRLRELWVDAASYSVLQVLTKGNFSEGPPTSSKWLTTYRDVNGCREIDREVALDTLDYGHDRQYTNTTISFDIIEDPTAYRSPVLTFRRPQADDVLVEPDDPK